MSFQLFYRKNKNEDMFSDLEKSSLKLSNLQNYIPIYNNFFSLNETNFNNINLNNKYLIHSINDIINSNIVDGSITDISGNIKKTNIFLKFSPLLDPVKYMVGKYDLSDNTLFNLPSVVSTTEQCHPKILDKNNSAYIDGFFSYLTSQILHEHNFIHGLDYYGSFLADQAEFSTNVIDDIEYLCESNFFNKHKNVLFTIDDRYQNEILNFSSRKYKKYITIAENTDVSLSSIDDINFDSVFHSIENNDEVTLTDLSNSCIFDFPIIKSVSSKSSSTCSSRSSNTSDEDVSDRSSYDSECSESILSDDDGDDDDEILNAYIKNFPVQVICLEKCENTLDYLMLEGKLSEKEWTSVFMQVIMTLITYQKMFSLTHNDLHTNNIMYVKTEKQFLYYYYNKTYYKVPTYGKIFKIIDFGRSIYKFNGSLMCSDSFHPQGDAATQYNFEPYMDNNKPRLEPNPSFDLCRLACALFDYFVEDLDIIKDAKKCSPITRLVIKWCRDDKGRNVLYKNNGDERYPEFKLYKMISRSVHNHVPHDQLDHYLFKNYITSRKKINRKIKIINIDNLPSYI